MAPRELALADAGQLSQLLQEHLIAQNQERIRVTQNLVLGTLKAKANQKWVMAVRAGLGAIDRSPDVPRVRAALVSCLREADCLPASAPPEWLQEQATRVQRLLVRGRRIERARQGPPPQVELSSDSEDSDEAPHHYIGFVRD